MKPLVKFPASSIVLTVNILGLGLFGLQACSKKTETTMNQAPIPTPTVTVTVIEPSPSALPTPLTFEEKCKSSNGELKQRDGVDYCETYTFWSKTPEGLQAYVFPDNVAIPRLTPDEPQGAYAFDTGLKVMPEDQVIYDVSGAWGGSVVENIPMLWKFSYYNTWSTSCNQIGISGQLADSKVGYFKDYFSGLLATDSKQVYPLALNQPGAIHSSYTALTAAGSFVVKNSGTLRMGINTPAYSGSCMHLTVQSLKVRHCETETQASIRCDSPLIVAKFENEKLPFFQKYCKAHYSSALLVNTDFSGAFPGYSWKCQDQVSGEFLNLNVEESCRLYGYGVPQATCADSKDPYCWVCKSQ